MAPGPDPKSSSDYIQFKCTPPGGDLNRWSTVLTRGHDFPAAQVRRDSSSEPRTQIIETDSAGHVVRRRRSGSRDNEEGAPGRHRIRLVGGQPLQVGRISIHPLAESRSQKLTTAARIVSTMAAPREYWTSDSTISQCSSLARPSRAPSRSKACWAGSTTRSVCRTPSAWAARVVSSLISHLLPLG